MFNNAVINLAGRSAIPVGAGAQSDVLPEQSVWDVYAAALSYIKVAALASDVSAATGYPVPAGSIVSVKIDRAGMRIGSTGAVILHRVD
ncbi:hypothetical protein [Rhizobium phage RHph_X2_28B]|uniref:hypothetical protein n=1 Tax=Rhizobium phage RHph_X2_28B TaxID=2836086 RepID=UPI0023290C44|nr:hypothetical protein PP751_gp079 [Rhizobium phage RHph_X2_28B]QWY83531.1 hypothetical protein [Rhizobium phage RHph_X2_28B]QWY83767.1 hypothetical protein [Rhizobium phage RHph_X3_15]